MKPRLFIGSSREAITIAYAAQQNLHHTAEVTVWDQGVFQLSATALESLLKVLSTCDFGIFIFSPDDVLTMRGKVVASVRDNVIFELGLFVGVLGRDRCFIFLPDKSGELHIPTDLMGMTPGHYETNRSDSSDQAATAPACHQVRLVVEQLGIRPGRQDPQQKGPAPEEQTTQQSSLQDGEAMKEVKEPPPLEQDSGWIDAYVEDKYADALKLIQKDISKERDPKERLNLESWAGRIQFHISPAKGIAQLEALSKAHPQASDPYEFLVSGYASKDMYLEALQVVERGLQQVKERDILVSQKVKALSELDRQGEIEAVLSEEIKLCPEAVMPRTLLADHYQKAGQDEQALAVLEDAEDALPDNPTVLEKYAKLLDKDKDRRLALVAYSKLVSAKSSDPSYLTLRANALLELGFNDLAMREYKAATKMAEDSQGWILANIGNLYKNRGFYGDAIEYLRKALALEPDHQYAIDRLSLAIKAREDEDKKHKEAFEEGRKALLAAKIKRRAPKA